MDNGALGVYACLFLGLFFEVFLLISFLEKTPGKKTAFKPSFYPTTTILVPCWNKAKTLGATVESLLALEYPKDKLSILIIDDGSTDETYEAAQRFAHNPQVRILQKKNEGSKYSALNFGIANSEGELVGCLDADSFVAPDALLEVVKRFEHEPEIMAVTPAMKVHHPKNLLELMQAVEYAFGIFCRKMFDNLSSLTVIPGPFSIYKREVFTTIGTFRKAHHTEDMEMAFRMHANGLRIANAHTALVSTKVPTNLGALIRQRIRWSRGFLENARDYSYMFFNPRYGNLGFMALPLGLAAFIAGIYSAIFLAYSFLSMFVTSILDMAITGIPPQLPSLPRFEWFYMDTSMTTVLVFTVLALTLVAIFIGKQIAQTKLPLHSLISYFALFGFIAPVWLARAIWDTARSKETGWLT
jgi:cellulose synthase/poly-beta-1,6-N-acetylglucosamine synthase-like glycosyltransferase